MNHTNSTFISDRKERQKYAFVICVYLSQLTDIHETLTWYHVSPLIFFFFYFLILYIDTIYAATANF
jgi:hypothetical protein